jgi:phospholipase C
MPNISQFPRGLNTFSSFDVPNQNDPQRIMKCFYAKQLPLITTLANSFVVCDRWFSSIPGPTTEIRSGEKR